MFEELQEVFNVHNAKCVQVNGERCDLEVSWSQILNSISNTLGVWTLSLGGEDQMMQVRTKSCRRCWERALIRPHFRKTADNIADYGSQWEDIIDKCF